MGQFCRRHAYRGGKTPAELLGRLRAAPSAANPIAAPVLASVVAASVAQIRLLNGEIARLERTVATRSPRTPRPRCSRTPTGRQRQPGSAHRRDRAAAGTLRQPRTGRGHVRRRPRHPGVGQDPHRRFPLRRQQARPSRHHRLRRQLPAPLGLGSRALPPSPSPRCSPPPRRAHRGPRLDPCHLGLLAHRHPLRPVTTPRRTARRSVT